MTLTVHGLQPDQAGDKVVKVDSHVGLRVAQDDQLEQVVGQLETWEETKMENQTTKQCQKNKFNPAGNNSRLFFTFLFLVLKRKEIVPADSRAILIS